MAAEQIETFGKDNMADKLGLICSICLEVFRNPKCLPCLHSFCTSCLEDYAAKESNGRKMQGAIDCPICRKRFTMTVDLTTEEWVKQLPSNYDLRRVVDRLSCNSDNDVKKAHLCEPCKKVKKHKLSTMFCKDCKEFICDECVNIHKRFSHMERHRMVKFEEQKNEEMLILGIGHWENCPEDDKPLKLYCGYHSKLLCTVCSFTEHRNCRNVIKLDTIDAKENEVNGDMLKIRYVNLKNKHELSLKFYENNEKDIKTQVSTLEDKLKSTRKKLIDKWGEFEKTVLGEAEQVKKEKVDSCKKNRAEIERQLDALNGTVRTLDTVTKQGTPSQTFISLHKLKEQLDTYKQSAQGLFSDLKSVKVELQLGKHIERVLEEGIHIGTLLYHATPHTVKSLNDYKPVKLKLMVTKVLKAGRAGNDKEPLLSGLEYLPDGRLVVVDNQNMKCMLMDGDLNVLGFYQFHTYPRCVVSDTDDTVMITCGEDLTQLRINPDNTFIHIATTAACNAFSISMMDDDNFIVGGYDDDKPVRAVSRSGVVTDLELDLPEGKFGIGETYCCFRKELKQLVLTVRDQNTVYIYNTAHKQRLVVRHDDIKTPCGVAIDRTGCSFVCGQDTHCVVQISPLGEVIATVKLNSMHYPRHVTLSSDDRKLTVSNACYNARKLQVYRIS